MWDLITDSLVRHYWLQKWYGDCQGIVEYLGDWVRDYSSPQDAKKLGILVVIIIALLVGHHGARMFKNRPKHKEERE